jgi:hypothetical protein
MKTAAALFLCTMLTAPAVWAGEAATPEAEILSSGSFTRVNGAACSDGSGSGFVYRPDLEPHEVLYTEPVLRSPEPRPVHASSPCVTDIVRALAEIGNQQSQSSGAGAPDAIISDAGELRARIAAFEAADKNEDGLLDSIEERMIAKARRAGVFDDNFDGLISLAEFTSAASGGDVTVLEGVIPGPQIEPPIYRYWREPFPSGLTTPEPPIYRGPQDRGPLRPVDPTPIGAAADD